MKRQVFYCYFHIDEEKKAEKLAKALSICTETEKKVVVTGDTDGATCAEFSNYVMETIKNID